MLFGNACLSLKELLGPFGAIAIAVRAGLQSQGELPYDPQIALRENRYLIFSFGLLRLLYSIQYL